jgi:hypothetical protein
MVARDALHRVNGSASLFIVKPLIVMAAKALGPGPTRLKLVKLAHNLSAPAVVPPEAPQYVEEYVEEQAEPTQRAA